MPLIILVSFAIWVNEYCTTTCRRILDGTAQADGTITYLLAKLWMAGEEWAWCFLNHLLMSALDTTFALAHVNHITISISKDLAKASAV